MGHFSNLTLVSTIPGAQHVARLPNFPLKKKTGGHKIINVTKRDRKKAGQYLCNTKIFLDFFTGKEQKYVVTVIFSLNLTI
jgi:hypothetical protein